VKRVRKRSRLKSINKTQGLDAAGGADGSFAPIGDVDGDQNENTRQSLKKKKAGRSKRGGASGDVDAVEGVDEDGVSLATDGAVTRKGSGGFSENRGDSFEQGREAYEAYLKGNVETDAERFETLKAGGAQDDFDPALEPRAVERLGQFKSAAHLIRLYDHWTLEDVPRTEAIGKAAEWLGGFQRVDNVKKVLIELESKPIRDIYPLEITLQLLETAPHKLPGVKPGIVFGANDALSDGSVKAGHAMQIGVPPDMRMKSFALLGGGRPGYEFFPSPKKDGHYTLLVDTPGEWEFAVFAVRTEKLGKMERETPGGVVERSKVKVEEMGRKEAPGNDTVH
jgi:hypothetical protein